jgi:hypothetical protein
MISSGLSVPEGMDYKNARQSTFKAAANFLALSLPIGRLGQSGILPVNGESIAGGDPLLGFPVPVGCGHVQKFILLLGPIQS